MIKINEVKATEIVKTKLRKFREVAFAENDIRIQNALIDGDVTAKTKAVSYRDYLRDLPANCDEKSVKELKSIVDTGLLDYDGFSLH